MTMNPCKLFNQATFTVILFLLANCVKVDLSAQSRTMSPDVYKEWNRIQQPKLSDNGDWITYLLTNENDRSQLNVYNTRTKERFSFDRASKVNIDPLGKFIAFHASAHPDSIKTLKRRKVKKSKMPKDTLVIFSLDNKKIERVPNILSYKMNNDEGGKIAFRLANRSMKEDSTLVKKENKDNGSRLVIKDVLTGKARTVPYVTSYAWSKKGNLLACHSSGADTTRQDKVLLYDAINQQLKPIYKVNGRHQKFTFDASEEHLAFLSDRDTLDDIDRSMELVVYKIGQAGAKIVLDKDDRMMSPNLEISANRSPYFIENSSRLIFGVAPLPTMADTTLLDEEIVDVEIWHYQDQRLYTQQIVNKKDDLKKTFHGLYDVASLQKTLVNDDEIPECTISRKQTGSHVLAYDNTAYQKYITWEGHDYKDLYKVNLKTGQKTLIQSKLEGNPSLSPNGKFAVWYTRSDTSWYSHNLEAGQTKRLSQGRFYDELNDRPMHPFPSGRSAWVDNGTVLVNGHYDIWQVDLSGSAQPVNLTNGRSKSWQYRYISMDNDILSLPSDTTIILRAFNRETKASGYISLNLKTNTLSTLMEGPFRLGTRIIKAKDTDDIIYTKEDFDIFPDLIHSDLGFKEAQQVSNANPQQGDYGWGSIELKTYTDHNGVTRQALLAKPPNFNPAKKYPLLVNFYEKSSDRLHSHRAPYAHRSTINYTYYTNNGYLIYNPDVYYEDGYPGESALNAVNAAVDDLIEEGYVDTENMGLQGHSWGGYQIAYMLTRTNRFKCAESGAPVVNMISAYGGIRWGSGLSRMFQYERTQSRLGVTLWERPDLYIHNSPVFNLDKTETPVLILHNDNDGAVPWYQGIEYFVGLRRLGKPAWMLNYNDEPHWPVKRQNRMDFNKRMEQFFNHYLKGDKMPVWMEKGVPEIYKGIEDGFEMSK